MHIIFHVFKVIEVVKIHFFAEINSFQKRFYKNFYGINMAGTI